MMIYQVSVFTVVETELINWIAPQSNQSLLDIAGGTGDVAKLL